MKNIFIKKYLDSLNIVVAKKFFSLTRRVLLENFFSIKHGFNKIYIIDISIIIFYYCFLN